MKKLLCFVLVFLISFSLVSQPVEVKADVSLTNEMIDLFIDLCYTSTDDSARMAKMVLRGEILGTEEVLMEIMRYATRLCGYANQWDALPYDERVAFATISTATKWVNAGVSIARNAISMLKTSNYMQRGIDGIQIALSLASAIGLSLPAVKVACSAAELALIIDKGLQDSILNEYGTRYQNALMLAKYAGSELPSPIGYVTVTSNFFSQYTQRQVDAMLAVVFLQFHYEEVLNSVPGNPPEVTFTITYDSNCSDVSDYSYTYYASKDNFDESYTMERNGYIFSGWYWDSECTDKWDEAIYINRDLTFYAKWTRRYYTITFNSNCDDVKNILNTYDLLTEKWTLPTMLREGYVFGGWYWDAPCLNKVTEYSRMTDNVFYAKWIDRYHTITYDSNCEDVENMSVTYDILAEPTEHPKMMRKGYVFGGWYLDSECTDKCDEKINLTSDLILYAKWVPVFEFEISNGQVTITELLGLIIGDDGIKITDIVIPETIHNLPVTGIATGAFIGNLEITSVTIPASIKSIGKNAFFNCKNLKKVYITDLYEWCNITFDDEDSNPLINGAELYLNDNKVIQLDVPSDVEIIRDFSFINCTSIEKINIPDSVKEIGEYSFMSCDNLKNVTIADGVTQIGKLAFERCINLTDVTMGKNVTEIGDYAFQECSELKNISFSNLLESIGEKAFYRCTSLEKAELPPSLRIIKEGAFQECTSVSKLNLNEGITRIYSYAFAECGALENMTVPDSVVYIEDFVWMECRKLKTITFGKGIKDIGMNVIWGCENMETVYWNAERVNEGDDMLNTQYNPFSNMYEELYTQSFSVVFGESVKCIPGGIFSGGCINSLTLNEGLEIIGDWAFYRCTDIQNKVVIPDSVKIIGEEAFGDCYNISEFELGKNIEKIGAYAFSLCENITEINIGENVTEIGRYAFYRTYNLKDITVDKNNEFYCSEDGVLFDKDKTKLIYYSPKQEIESYFVPQTVAEISSNAFDHANNLVRLILPSGIKNIGSVYDCSNLENINFPEGLTSIGGFYNCHNIKEILLPQSIANVYRDFWWCDGLTDVYYAGSEEQWNSMPNPAELQERVTVYYNCRKVNETTKVMVNGTQTEIHLMPTNKYNSKYIFAFYENDKLADVKIEKNDSEKIEISTNVEYNNIKIMCWEDMIPCSDAVEIMKEGIL